MPIGVALPSCGNDVSANNSLQKLLQVGSDALGSSLLSYSSPPSLALTSSMGAQASSLVLYSLPSPASTVRHRLPRCNT